MTRFTCAEIFTDAMVLFLILALVAPAGASSYRALWEAGEYGRALESLEALRRESHSLSLELDYADLLFHIGRVDEAIAVVEPIAAAYPLPSFVVRLARLYHYRGRLQDYRDLLDSAARQASSLLSSYRLNQEEWLALGQLMEMRGEDPQAVLAHYERLAERYPDFAAARVAAGDLAYGRYAYDVAARHYGGALDIDPGNQEALAGLAASYYQSADPRLDATLDSLLARNPRQPRALLLRAEQALDLGRSGEALERLEEVLATNPNHLEALCLKAAALFLQDRPADLERVQQQALSLHPSASSAFRVPGRIASRHYRFAEGRRFQEQALDIDPDDHRARLLLAFDLLRLGEDARARPELEKVFAADPYNVQAYNLLGVSDAIAGFGRVRRDPFVLQAPELETEVLAAEMLDLLEEAAARYQEQYRVDLQAPVLVQVFADHDEFMVRSVGLPGSAGHLGICFGRVVTMDSPRARPPGSMNWQQVLWHEFAHVITLQKTRNRIPRWLSEGISVYEETRKDSAWGQPLDPAFKRIAADAPPSGVEDLEAFFTRPSSPAHLLYGYFAAGEFVRAYVDAYSMEALVRALQAIGEGAPAPQALSRASGENPSQVDQRFRLHLARRCAPLAHLPDAAGEADGAPFSAALQRGDKAARAGHLQEAERAYLEAHALFPDPVSLRRLAGLYKEHGPPEKYRQSLERLAALDPRAADACSSLAALRAAEGRWREAALWLERAARVDPFDIGLARRRAEYLLAAGEEQAAARQCRLLLHLDPARRTDHRLLLARTLFRQGELPAARTEVLTLLEEMPHFWEAQRLLLEIADAEGAPP